MGPNWREKIKFYVENGRKLPLDKIRKRKRASSKDYVIRDAQSSLLNIKEKEKDLVIHFFTKDWKDLKTILVPTYKEPKTTSSNTLALPKPVTKRKHPRFIQQQQQLKPLSPQDLQAKEKDKKETTISNLQSKEELARLRPAIIKLEKIAQKPLPKAPQYQIKINSVLPQASIAIPIHAEKPTTSFQTQRKCGFFNFLFFLPDRQSAENNIESYVHFYEKYDMNSLIGRMFLGSSLIRFTLFSLLIVIFEEIPLIPLLQLFVFTLFIAISIATTSSFVSKFEKAQNLLSELLILAFSCEFLALFWLSESMTQSSKDQLGLAILITNYLFYLVISIFTVVGVLRIAYALVKGWCSKKEPIRKYTFS